MIKSKSLLLLCFLGFACVALVIYFASDKRTEANSHLTPETKTSHAPTPHSPPTSVPSDIPLNEARKSQPSSAPDKNEEELFLTTGNFESFVQRCFAGARCKIEKPGKMYQDFKAAGNKRAMDNLISFLRSKLQDPVYKDLYQEPLKALINDFYPENEKDFQMAAYFAYLGDRQKAFETYMKLEKKAQGNPDYEPAPRLNIANVLFDSGKFREALPYYQAARQDYISGRAQSMNPSNQWMIEFIEERIQTIKTKL